MQATKTVKAPKCRKWNTCTNENCSLKHGKNKDLLRANNIYTINCTGMTDDQVLKIIVDFKAAEASQSAQQPKPKNICQKKNTNGSGVQTATPCKVQKQKPNKKVSDAEQPKPKNLCKKTNSNGSEQVERCNFGFKCKFLRQACCKKFHTEDEIAKVRDELLNSILTDDDDYDDDLARFIELTAKDSESSSESDDLEYYNNPYIEALTIEQLLKQKPTF